MKLKILIVVALLLIIPSVLPLFHKGFFPMHDFTHAARLAELDRGLRAGQLPARWSDNFGWGYGMPLMHYYAPLFYYVAEVFYLFGLSAVFCIKIVILLTILLGFIASFKLGEQFFGKWGGMITAVAFSYAPYRAVQLYVRGALTELLATSFIPLVLWFIYRLIKNSFEKKNSLKSLLGFILALTGLFLSHNVITLIIIPLLGLWGLAWTIYFALINKKVEKKIVFYIVGAVIGAIILSAWFLIPAFFEKDQTIVQSISGGYSYYKLHFVYFRQFFKTDFKYGGSILGPDDDISFQFGLAQVGLIVLSAFTFVYLWFVKRKNNKLQLFLFPLLIITLALFSFMMSFHSTFIWEKIPILQMAQFPWRFLSITAVLVALFGGYSAYLINLIKIPALKYLFGLLLLFAIFWFNKGFFKPEKYLENNELYYTDPKLIQEHMSGILKDYLPKTAIEQLPLHLPDINLNNQSYDPVDLQQKNGNRYFHIDSIDGGNVRLAVYDFIGWQVKVDNNIVEHHPDLETGFISFEIPAGSHFIQAQIIKTPLQFWSDLISLMGWLILCIAIIYQSKKGIIKTQSTK